MSDADRTRRVLLVVCQQGNARVLDTAVAEVGMTPIHAQSLTDIERWLAEAEPPAVALVDVQGFGGEVWSLCHQLHEGAIPFVVLSPAQARQASHQSLAYGAASVVEKPIAKESLLTLLQSLSQ